LHNGPIAKGGLERGIEGNRRVTRWWARKRGKEKKRAVVLPGTKKSRAAGEKKKGPSANLGEKSLPVPRLFHEKKKNDTVQMGSSAPQGEKKKKKKGDLDAVPEGNGNRGEKKCSR